MPYLWLFLIWCQYIYRNCPIIWGDFWAIFKKTKHWACWPLNRLYQYHARCHASKKIKNRLNVPCSNNFWQIENFRKYVSRIKKRIEHLSKWQMLKYIRKHMIFDQNYFSKLILEWFNLLFQLIKVQIFRSSNFWITSRVSKNDRRATHNFDPSEMYGTVRGFDIQDPGRHQTRTNKISHQLASKRCVDPSSVFLKKEVFG